jgi:predicted MFS family arabinose efflux permease
MTNATVGFFLVLIMEIIIGMMASAISIYLITLVQRITPRENLGKVMATIVAVAQCAVPLGQLLMGLIFRNSAASVYIPVLLISVLVLLISGVCYWLFKETKESDLNPVKK